MQIGPANIFTARRGADISELDTLAAAGSSLPKRIRSAFFRAYNYFNKQPFGDYGSREIPQWDGGEDSRGRVYRSCWNKVAAILKKHKIDDVERFVLAQFAGRANKKIYPTVLLAKDAIDAYKEYAETADEALRCAMQGEVAVFTRAAATHTSAGNKIDIWRSVLGDMTQDISPLMRYIIATSEGLTDIAEGFRKLAALQFLLDPSGYVRVWGCVPGVGDVLHKLAQDCADIQP